MAGDAEDDPNIDDDTLELTDEVQQPDDGDSDNPDNEDGGEDEEVLTFGDDVAEAKPDDSSLIKHLRNQIRERDKKLAEAGKTAPKPIEVGQKPDLWEDCEGDVDRYDRETDAWRERKVAAERQANEAGQSEQQANEAWQGELKRYNEGKATLGYADVDDAEATVTAALNTVQQAVMVKAANNPSKVMYALGKNPDRLTHLASISDPLKFAAEVARLEGQLKVIKKRKTAEPEKIERGSGSMAKADKQLEKLEKDAEKSGDRTKVVAYKKKLKAKS